MALLFFNLQVKMLIDSLCKKTSKTTEFFTKLSIWIKGSLKLVMSPERLSEPTNFW